MSLKETIPASPPRPTVGLVAGAGRFPIVFAEKARSLGLRVVCIGIHGMAAPELSGCVDRIHWMGITKLGCLIRLLKKEKIRQVVMAGKIYKVLMHTPWFWLRMVPDWRTLRWWYLRRRRNNSDDSMLLGVIDELATEGLIVTSALDLCPELLIRPGLLTKRAPSAKEEADIAYGWELAKEMGRLDVGQSVAVKKRAVLAVEAIEGTDQAILRAGQLCRTGGFVVVKVAKPQQDRRFDVPTVGRETIEALHKAGGSVLAVEAGQTIVLDQEETVALADRYGLTMIALERPAA